MENMVNRIEKFIESNKDVKYFEQIKCINDENNQLLDVERIYIITNSKNENIKELIKLCL